MCRQRSQLRGKHLVKEHFLLYVLSYLFFLSTATNGLKQSFQADGSRGLWPVYLFVFRIFMGHSSHIPIIPSHELFGKFAQNPRFKSGKRRDTRISRQQHVVVFVGKELRPSSLIAVSALDKVVNFA